MLFEQSQHWQAQHRTTGSYQGLKFLQCYHNFFTVPPKNAKPLLLKTKRLTNQIQNQVIETWNTWPYDKEAKTHKIFKSKCKDKILQNS